MPPGLRYGQYFPVLKIRVISKKSVSKKLYSVVILRLLFRKIVDMFFLILSMIGPDLPYPYQCGSKNYNLCLSEKLQIFQADPKQLLNKSLELVSNCRY